MLSSGDELLPAILSNLPLGVWVARAPSGEVVYANPAFRSILGMDAVEGVSIQGAPSTYGIYDQAGQLYPVDQLPFSRVLATGAPVTVDDIVIHRGPAGPLNVRAYGAPVRDAAGTIVFVVVAFLDITAEVRAVAQRKQAEEQLRFAVHHAPVVLWAAELDGTITLSEGSALTAMGLKSGQLLGQSIPELYEERPDLVGDFRRAASGETVSHVSVVGDVVLDSWITPVRDASGEVTGVIGMSTDVTERRRLEARIIQNDRVAAMGTLAASVAHEINNPLTYVLGSLAAGQANVAAAADAVRAAREGGEGPRLRELGALLAELTALLEDARTGGERIGRIARDLHSFSRPTDEAVRPVGLDTVIGAVLHLVRKEIAARARLTVTLGETPPVRGDESRLVQVVLNLLVNAWQALPEPDPARHEITIRTWSEGESAFIEVCDSGPGIPPENRERVFDPFFTTKEVGAGTGLGLFVCRNIVQGFGGQISVSDRAGGGAAFRVRLPVLTPASTGVAPELSAARSHSGRRARVLIIDDDERVARVLALSLQEEFDVRAVLDGQEALELLLADESLDLAYCDLMMRGLTGMDLHELVRRQAPERLPKLVFMTGGAFTPQAARFAEGLGDAIIHKPFDILAETRQRLASPAR